MLTEAAVREIRSLYRGGLSIRRVAARFGVHRTTVRCVLTGRTWTHVADPEGPIVMRPSGRPPGSPPRGSRLDPAKVRAIRRRRARGESGASIARAFGVTQATVSNVVRGRTWKDVR